MKKSELRKILLYQKTTDLLEIVGALFDYDKKNIIDFIMGHDILQIEKACQNALGWNFGQRKGGIR